MQAGVLNQGRVDKEYPGVVNAKDFYVVGDAHMPWVMNEVSGHPLNDKLYFALVDEFNQIYDPTFFTHIPEISLEIVDIRLPIHVGNYELQNQTDIVLLGSMVGTTTARMNNTGIFTFSNLQLVGTPNETLLIEVTEITDIFSRHTFDPASNIIDNNDDYAYEFMFHLRDCAVGEIYNYLANTCETCPAGKYSVVQGAVECFPCMENAVCYGGNNISVDAGYWRTSISSENVIFCRDYEAWCLGGFNSTCGGGYIGPICSSCDTSNPNETYAHETLTTCMTCQDQVSRVIRVVIISILTAIILTLSIYSGYHESYEFFHYVVKTSVSKRR